MNKSILVIDTPKSCMQCPLRSKRVMFTNKCVIMKDEHNLTEYMDNYNKNEGTFKSICHPYENKSYSWKEFPEKKLNDTHPQCPLRDTTELLEVLEEVSEEYNIRESYSNKATTMPYNKLHKALGGQDE